MYLLVLLISDTVLFYFILRKLQGQRFAFPVSLRRYSTKENVFERVIEALRRGLQNVYFYNYALIDPHLQQHVLSEQL